MSATVKMANRLCRQVVATAPRKRDGPTPTKAAVMMHAIRIAVPVPSG